MESDHPKKQIDSFNQVSSEPSIVRQTHDNAVERPVRESPQGASSGGAQTDSEGTLQLRPLVASCLAGRREAIRVPDSVPCETGRGQEEQLGHRRQCVSSTARLLVLSTRMYVSRDDRHQPSSARAALMLISLFVVMVCWNASMPTVRRSRWYRSKPKSSLCQ